MFMAIVATGILIPERTWAILDDDTVKGAATNHVFSSSFGDSIDTLSGQLHFTIPIGPEFRIADSLSYQLQLSYSSKIWRYYFPLYSTNQGINQALARYRMDGRAQAGAGFNLHMGRIYWRWEVPLCSSPEDTRSLILQTPDGTEHTISDSEFGNRVVTTDSTYKQVRSLGDDPNGRLGYIVTDPDGTLYFYDHWVEDPSWSAGDPPAEACSVDGKLQDPRSSDIRGWYPTLFGRVTGNGGHSVTIEYETTLGMEHMITEITDSNGRSITFQNTQCDESFGLPCSASKYLSNAGYVTSVSVPAFQNSPSDPNTVTYTFHYEIGDTTDKLVRLTDPNYNDGTTLDGEVFLKSLQFPEGYSTSFDYRDPNGAHVGVVTQRTLPTGAYIDYEYTRYKQASSVSLNVSCVESCTAIPLHRDEPIPPAVGTSPPCGNTCIGGGNTEENLPATLAVTAKAVTLNPDHAGPFDPNLPTRTDLWYWNRRFALDPETYEVLSNPWKVIEVDPFDNWTAHYFGASTPYDPNQDLAQLHEDDWQNGLPQMIDYYLGPGGSLLRRVINDYEDDGDPNVPGGGFRHYMTNRRVFRSTTIDFEAGTHMRSIEKSDWDGLGHHRMTTELRADGTPYRSKYVGYHCSGVPLSCIRDRISDLFSMR
jgi:hypothetical protein